MTPAVRDRGARRRRRRRAAARAGGCCALVPGALAGLRDAAGPLGVAYVDGHVDVYDGRSSPTGEAADMPIGVAFGLGPEPWVQAAGGPSTAPGHVVVLGARDPEEAEDIAALLAGRLAALAVARAGGAARAGPGEAGRAAAERLGRGRFWIHLDVDVLDEVEMPATDYLMPGGLELGRAGGAAGPARRLPGARRPQPRLREPGQGPGGRMHAPHGGSPGRRAQLPERSTGARAHISRLTSACHGV